MEHIIHTHIIQHCDSQNILQNCQHNFRKQHSCESQLIITTEELKRIIDQKKQVDIIILDFSKAFDTVAQTSPKIKKYRIQGKNKKWLNKWLKFNNQKVFLDGEIFYPVPVTCRVPHGTFLSPLMFLLYINDINQNINSKIILFADDCVLYRDINLKFDCLELQQDLHKLVVWSHIWQRGHDKCLST